MLGFHFRVRGCFYQGQYFLLVFTSFSRRRMFRTILKGIKLRPIKAKSFIYLITEREREKLGIFPPLRPAPQCQQQLSACSWQPSLTQCRHVLERKRSGVSFLMKIQPLLMRRQIHPSSPRRTIMPIWSRELMISEKGSFSTPG